DYATFPRGRGTRPSFEARTNVVLPMTRWKLRGKAICAPTGRSGLPGLVVPRRKPWSKNKDHDALASNNILDFFPVSQFALRGPPHSITRTALPSWRAEARQASTTCCVFRALSPHSGSSCPEVTIRANVRIMFASCELAVLLLYSCAANRRAWS